MARVLENTLLRRVGEVSNGFYVLNVIWYLRDVCEAILIAGGMWPWLAYMSTVAVWFMVTYGLARLSHTYLEKPLMARGRREQAAALAS